MAPESKPIFPGGTGTHVASIVLPNKHWRTFVHTADNQIHQLILSGPDDLTYTDTLVDGPIPMVNSPVAAISSGTNVSHLYVFTGWGVHEHLQIRLFYFTADCKVQEMFWNNYDDPSPVIGTTLGDVVWGSHSLYAYVRKAGDTSGQIRVGYQSSSAPTTITESVYTPDSGWATTRTYPSMMP
jgi:hypothetical protein